MASVLALLSKAFFEKKLLDGQTPALDDVVPVDTYFSKHKALQSLADGGDLYLVTVRPPDESLWLVATIRSPSFVDDAWSGTGNDRAVVDATTLRDQLKFSNGKGPSMEAGKLGMSLQTPRTLTADDVALLEGLFGWSTASPSTETSSTESSGVEVPLFQEEQVARDLHRQGRYEESFAVLTNSFRHFNAHEAETESGRCLCQACIQPSVCELVVNGMRFERDFVVKRGRALFFWRPESVAHEDVADDICHRLLKTLRRGHSRNHRNLRVTPWNL